jgi:hypothetical protein
MWTFGELRQLAIQRLGRLSNINPVEKVILARNYKVESLLVQGYKELIKRKEGPSVEEAKVLGYETAIRLYEKRENHWGPESVSRSTQRRQEHVANVRLVPDIEKIFKEELDSIKRDSREIEKASRPDNYGIGNDKPDNPSGSAAFISDSDSDWDLDVSVTRKRART